MPLVCLAALAYGGGLAVATLRPAFASLVGALALLAGVLGWLHGRGTARASAPPAAAILFVVGIAAALDVRARDRSCAAQAASGAPLRVLVADSVASGTAVTGTAALPGGCSVRARVAVREGSAPAGSWIAARGAVTVLRRYGRTALRIDDAAVVPLVQRDWRAAWRAGASRTIERRFGDDAPMVLALVVAEQGEIPRELRDRFADSGLIHALSISGLHVAVVAAALELLALLARAPTRAAAVAGGVGAGFYVLLLGAPPPATRAVVMLGVLLASRLLQRPTSPWAVLAVGVTVPLLTDPRAVANIGWQLSAAGMATLVAAGSVRRRWLKPNLRGWRLGLASALLASLAATLGTAPIVAWHFGRVSAIGPVANLFATPIVGVLQPALFLALALDPFPEPAALVADACRVLLRAFAAAATYAAELPGAAWTVRPSAGVAIACIAAAIAFGRAVTAAHPARPALAGVSALALALWIPVLPRWSRGVAELHVIDVGQGDALAIRSPRGRWIVMDAGNAWPGGDEGSRTVVPYLSRRGGKVVAFILSHPDNDHVGGAPAVLGTMRPGVYWDAAYRGGSEAYRRSLGIARDAGVPWRRVGPGDSLDVDGVVVTVLAPDSSWTAHQTDANEASVVVGVRFGAVRFLLTGDAETEEEGWLVRHQASRLRADVLKLGHHGSATSTTPGFLDAVAPRVAVVSVGAGNRYGHPHPDVLGRLAERGIPVWRTDRAGSLVVQTDGRRLTLLADGDRWDSSPP